MTPALVASARLKTARRRSCNRSSGSHGEELVSKSASPVGYREETGGGRRGSNGELEPLEGGGWGRTVIKKEFMTEKRKPARLRQLTRLLLDPDSTKLRISHKSSIRTRSGTGPKL